MYIVQKQTEDGKRLERFDNFVDALIYAFTQVCSWKLFIKTDSKPAKLLAYSERGI